MNYDRLNFLLPLLILIVLFSCTKNNCDIVGTWQLVSISGTSTQGDTLHPYGKDPYGMLMYDETGHMSVLLMQRDRPLFVTGDMRKGTDGEVRTAFEYFDAYCGTYNIDGVKKTVTHHLLGAKFPNWIGSDQLRYYQILVDTLRLYATPIMAEGVKWNLKAEWIRI